MSLWEMSCSGAVTILVVAVLRALTLHRLPKRTFLVLWGVALTRLLVPYSLPSAFSAYSLARRLTAAAIKESFVPAVQAAPRFPTEHAAVGGQALVATQAAAPTVDPWTLIWLLGTVGCALFFTAAYVRCRREFRASLPVDNEQTASWLQAHRLCRPIAVRQSDRVSAPLTYGVFRPVILLPKTVDWTDREALAYVLEHEYVHIRRFDALAKLALTCALCVHWFNPATWIMYVLANRDMELSCDEAVIRGFGKDIRAAYAMTLIRMEERRSGLSPLCSSFSKNPMEERIVAIMKLKKTSLAALCTAAALVVGVTTAFATSPQSEAAKVPGKLGLLSPVDTKTETRTILSYTDTENGNTYFSPDGGKTWEQVEDKDLYAAYGWDGVEWWTAEEYAAWLEQEKIDLQSIIGEQSWNPTDGWYTWTQELVDQAIARYEQTLKDIQAGQKVSKPTADGDAMVMYGYDPEAIVSANDTTLVFGSAEKMEQVDNDSVVMADKLTLTPALLAEYAAHGVTYDKEKDAFYFDGKLVRWFFDGYAIGDGFATVYDHTSPEGVVDIYTVRQATQNADGSTDPGGKLLEIKAYSQAEFDSRVLMTPEMLQKTAFIGFSVGAPGTTFAERFAKYKDHGITYVEADGASGRGNVYLNGRLVSRFADVAPDGSAFSFTSADEGGVSVRTVYDSNGRLSGVETDRIKPILQTPGA